MDMIFFLKTYTGHFCILLGLTYNPLMIALLKFHFKGQQKEFFSVTPSGLKTSLTDIWTVLRNTEILNIIGKSGRNEIINTWTQTEKDERKC